VAYGIVLTPCEQVWERPVETEPHFAAAIVVGRAQVCVAASLDHLLWHRSTDKVLADCCR